MLTQTSKARNDETPNTLQIIIKRAQIHKELFFPVIAHLDISQQCHPRVKYMTFSISIKSPKSTKQNY